MATKTTIKYFNLDTYRHISWNSEKLIYNKNDVNNNINQLFDYKSLALLLKIINQKIKTLYVCPELMDALLLYPSIVSIKHVSNSKNRGVEKLFLPSLKNMIFYTYNKKGVVDNE